jgi:uncharacterized glyoxalase superfamily protein PhnB
MKLIPYLNFEGNCEKAIDFYALILTEVSFIRIFTKVLPRIYRKII